MGGYGYGMAGGWGGTWSTLLLLLVTIDLILLGIFLWQQIKKG